MLLGSAENQRYKRVLIVSKFSLLEGADKNTAIILDILLCAFEQCYFIHGQAVTGLLCARHGTYNRG